MAQGHTRPKQSTAKAPSTTAEANGSRDDVRTNSGTPVKPIYTPDDVQGLDVDHDLGRPGQYPYVRGVYDTMYRGRLWTMRHISGFGGGEECNERLKMLLESGSTGLNIIFDLPAQRWFDCDDPRAKGQVGQAGVSLSTIQDMEELFDGIPIEQTNVSLVAPNNGPVVMALYLALAEKRGIPSQQLQGSLQNDPLKEYENLECGFHVFPIRPALKLAVDAMEHCIRNLPRWSPVTVNGHCLREFGISAAQETAVVLANAKEYSKGLMGRGLSPDTFAPRLGVFVASHHYSFLEEVAKYRALRRLWATMMHDDLGAQTERACALRIGTCNIGTSFTAQHARNNIARITLQVLAAVFGGCQSINTMAYDEPISLPTEDASYTSLSIQNIIAHETGIADIADPLGGSYAVESLTRALEEKISEILGQIDGAGGVVEAVESGFFETTLNGRETSLSLMQRIQSGEQVVVGFNKFNRDEEVPVPAFHTDPRYEESQRRKLAQFRASRDPSLVETGLRALEDAARRDENVMPSLVQAVKNGATVGETGEVLKQVYGEDHPTVRW